MSSVDLSAALEALEQEKVVGVPTDTVYGLAADPFSRCAVRSLFEIKGRGGHLPLVVLTAGLPQTEDMVTISGQAQQLLERYWPGPLTAVLPAKQNFPAGVGNHNRKTLAVRVPDQPLLIELLTLHGPLAVTSANRSGEPPVMDDVAARALFGEQVPVYLPGKCAGGVPSTVVDLTSPNLQILRPGPVELSDLAVADGFV